MTYEKALSLYRNDKTLQLLRADHFPLLIGFFHLVFKQQNKITYSQSDLASLLGDYLFLLEQQEISDYPGSPSDYLQKWAQQGYLRRYYESGDEPVYELSPATENALKWLDDLNKQQFIGTHSRLLHFFSLLQQIVNKTAGPYERIKQLEEQRKLLDAEIDAIRKGNYVKPTETQLKEDYFLAEETAKRLLADFRQVEENFRELDTQTRQTIIKSAVAKGKLLDDIFEKQDYLWNTDQGKSFQAFWEFMMSESMQKELDELIEKLNEIPAIRQIKQEQIVDRIKTNLVDAGDKVNRSNDGLIEQLRKFVEQKNLSESRYILRNIEMIENILVEQPNLASDIDMLMEIDRVFKPVLLMERPLFSPPVKIVFEENAVEEGLSDADTQALFEQFYVDLDELRGNIRTILRTHSQVSLSSVLQQYKPSKGIAEILGYMQIATGEAKHLVKHEHTEELMLGDNENPYLVQAPLIIFNR